MGQRQGMGHRQSQRISEGMGERVCGHEGAGQDLVRASLEAIGAGACAGSCDDLAVLEDQITICQGDREPCESLGEAERQLFFK
jgi:hypothetical protein